MRVHELAKKLGINSKQLMAQLTQRGIDVKNHMSVVPQETIDHYLQVATSIKHSPKKTTVKTASKSKTTTSPKVKTKKTPDTSASPKDSSREIKSAKKAGPKSIDIMEGITLGELAKKLETQSSNLIKHLMTKGHMFTVNQILDVELAAEIVKAFELTPHIISLDASEEETIEPEDEANLEPRLPVVTIMGHVDHGKTLLLDAIRSTNIVDKEAGGITQHIGAYKVTLPGGGGVTFLDTPGHEAFTSMRARGAKVTDIVVLVVAADDGVMPQTIEAIHHAQEAKVPIVVAVNKIDKPEANPDRVRQELTQHGLVPEDWGGSNIFANVSAKTHEGLDNLLEMLMLEAEMLELKANPDKPARGIIIEAKLDKGRGPVATVLVQSGTLRQGDPFVCGIYNGRVRAMLDEKGKKLSQGPPSTPVEVLGFSGVPAAGDSFAVVASERKGNQIAQLRQQKEREKHLGTSHRITLEDLHRQIEEGTVQDLKLIIKADVQGSVEAINESLAKLSTNKVQIKTIHGAVGAISEMDVMLASASNAIIIGFNVRPQPKAMQLAAAEQVDIRMYTIIYNLIAEVKAAMQGMLAPEYKELILGRAEAKEVFNVSKYGTIAGSLVQEGKIIRNAHARLLRDNVVVYEGTIETLRRFKDDVKEVASGYECGIKLSSYNDIKQGDIIEAFTHEEVAAQL